MTATKVTLLFQATTKDLNGDTGRLAGFSESYYSSLPIDSAALKTNWNNLAIARAALMPANVSIIGSRYQQVDPTGASRQFDNKYPPTSTLGNDLPGVAFQWTVRSATTFNQRNLILRGVPDARVVNGEYAPQAGYNAALAAFINQLTTNWQFRAIDRTILPKQIVSIVGGLLTTSGAHGLAAGDIAKIMSTKVGTDRIVTSYDAFVIATPSTTTATLAPTGRDFAISDSVRGRVRKESIIYPFFSLTVEEVVNPTPIHRKAGAPFKKFRGRRTVRH